MPYLYDRFLKKTWSTQSQIIIAKQSNASTFHACALRRQLHGFSYRYKWVRDSPGKAGLGSSNRSLDEPKHERWMH